MQSNSSRSNTDNLLGIISNMKDEIEKLFQLNVKEINFGIDRKFEKIILEPYEHINESKGKGFRSMMTAVYNFWLQVDEDKTELFSNLIQNFHTISLLIDDIQDSSHLRRRIPTAHIIYGADRTITAGDYIFFQTYHMMEKFENSKIFTILNEHFDNSLKGQAMEVYWRDNCICPTEDEYLDMISKKTGSTYQSISNTLEMLSPTDLSLCSVSVLFGLHFQISDDYNGLKSEIYSEGKGYCDDIREGKFTHPIVHAINSNPKDKRIMDILKMHTDNVDLKIKCLELLEEYGSLDYTKSKIKFYKALLFEEVAKLKINPHFKILFEITEGTNDQ